ALSAAVELAASLCLAAVLWESGGSVLSGYATRGELVAVPELRSQFFSPLRDLTAQYTLAQQAAAGAERVFSLFDEPEAHDAPGAVALTELRREIGFAGVRFVSRKDSPARHGASFVVPHGKTVALVGTTGAGKSTVAKLLTRLYELPRSEAGSITLDGVPVQDVSLDS